jgi:hypothetical protein
LRCQRNIAEFFLLGRAKDWGVKWTSYKDRDHDTAKGTMVQVLRLLERHLVLPRNDRTLLKAIDRVRKHSFPFKIHMRARLVTESQKAVKARTPNNQG